MIGFFVGLFAAAALYSAFGEYLAPKIGASAGVSDVIAFIVLWVVVPIVLGLVATILTKALKGMKLGLPNSLLGMVLSVLKYLVLMSCVFNVMSSLNIISREKTEGSVLYEPVKNSLTAAFKYLDSRSDKASAEPGNNASDDSMLQTDSL